MEADFMAKKWLLYTGIIAGLVIAVSVCGCVSHPDLFSKNISQPDPDTGIDAWVQAMNAHDTVQLYYLAPEEVQTQVSLAQFEKDNANNTLLQSDKFISGYQTLNETRNATTANIKAVVSLHQNVPGNSTQTQTIPLYLNFEEWYENGGWKVWTIPWS
jgi:hypothetical protein